MSLLLYSSCQQLKQKVVFGLIDLLSLKMRQLAIWSWQLSILLIETNLKRACPKTIVNTRAQWPPLFTTKCYKAEPEAYKQRTYCTGWLNVKFACDSGNWKCCTVQDPTESLAMNGDYCTSTAPSLLSYMSISLETLPSDNVQIAFATFS